MLNFSKFYLNVNRKAGSATPSSFLLQLGNSATVSYHLLPVANIFQSQQMTNLSHT